LEIEVASNEGVVETFTLRVRLNINDLRNCKIGSPTT